VGTYVGSSYLWATPRDLARFGQLWLMDGCWQGERLLPEGWVSESTAVSEPMRTRALGRDAGDVQGRQVWLNRPVPEIGQDALPWPGVPEGAYAALGHWKQSITVVPDAELVVVRTADDRDGSYEHARTLRLALQLVGASDEEP
jgi:CubicO group peptidase (beta-lactamase class C family)